MNTISLSRVALLAGLFAAAPVASNLIAAAQTAPAMGPATPAPAPAMAAPAVAAPAMAAPAAATAPAPAALTKTEAAKVEAQIKLLHTELQITPAEEPAWTQFADVMRNNANDMAQAFADQKANHATMNAEDDMQAYTHMAMLHADNMQKLSAAFTPLYDSFPETQKKIADAVFLHQHAAHKGEAGNTH